MKRTILSLIIIAVLSLLQGCRGGNNAITSQGEHVKMRHAQNIRMSELEDGSTLVTLINPWDTTRTMACYALIERGKDVPASLPQGVEVIEVPIERSIVYSGVHVSLLNELGALSSVSGVCDAPFINDTDAKKLIEQGTISDCGQSTAPNIEKIISSKPQVVLLSPSEKGNDAAKFSRTKIDVIFAADYMEATPLGRAEWMRFYGRLYGKGAEADSLFKSVEDDYLEIKHAATTAENHPIVIFDKVYSGVWYVPTSGSATGHLIEDAGGINPFSKRTDGGSASLSAEDVLYTAQKADIWLIRYYGDEPTLTNLASDNPLYTKFKAYTEGCVYGANTLETTLFEDASFHPHYILREMSILLHPELNIADHQLRYYKKLK